MKIFIFHFCFSVIGKWDQVTGINSPLYKSHTELENHEAWKNAVRIKKNFCLFLINRNVLFRILQFIIG